MGLFKKKRNKRIKTFPILIKTTPNTELNVWHEITMKEETYNTYPLFGDWDFILMINLICNGDEYHILTDFCYELSKIKGVTHIFPLDANEALSPKSLSKLYKENQ